MNWPKSADGFKLPQSAVASEPSAAEIVNEAVQSARVVIFAKTFCPFCKEVIALFSSPPYSTIPYRIIQLDTRPDGDTIQDCLLELTGARSVPRVFVDGVFLGGCDQTHAAHASGKLMRRLCGNSERSTTWRIQPQIFSALLIVCLLWLLRTRQRLKLAAARYIF